MNRVIHPCIVDTLCTCVVGSSFHISDLKGLRSYNEAFVFLLVDCKLIFSTIWTGAIVKLPNAKKKERKRSAYEAIFSWHGARFFFFFFKATYPPCVWLCHRSKLTGLGQTACPCIRLHSLKVWKYSVIGPPSPPPLPFTNYLSVSDKQPHQKRGFSHVNTELIHQWDALSSKQHPLALRCYLSCGKRLNSQDKLHGFPIASCWFWAFNTCRWCLTYVLTGDAAFLRNLTGFKTVSRQSIHSNPFVFVSVHD